MISKEQILVVDDDERIRTVLKRLLEPEGYEVTLASDGASASVCLGGQNFDLVLLDITMPDISGTELLEDIKANHADTSVIMVTAVMDTPTAIQCMKKGANDYIAKPFTLDTLLLSIGRAMERRRLELENREYQRYLKQKVEEQSRKIRTNFLNSLAALAYALEAKDEYTSGHSERVSKIAVSIGKKMGMPEDVIERIRLGGLLHDIGKIGVKEAVLNKTCGKLTDEDYKHIKSHCEIGERILRPIVDDEEILKVVKHHHEHYNGSGYPKGLSGNEIPLEARILAVGDAYDAMTSARAYRNALSNEIAKAELIKGKFTQFDPEAVDAFLSLDINTSQF